MGGNAKRYDRIVPAGHGLFKYDGHFAVALTGTRDGAAH